ncbi:MAG: ornithine cyclodeaminase family protein [Acidobacteriota bacterium]
MIKSQRLGENMVLLIRPREMSQLISMKEAIEAVEESFRQWAELPGVNAPRRRIHVPSGVRVSVHQGGVPGLAATGLMTHCEHVSIQSDGTQRYRLRGRPVHVLYSAQTGELMAILVGEPQPKELPLNGVTALRTAATSAVGTKQLARPDSRRIGLLGAGTQAKYHLLALQQIYPLTTVKVYSRNPENRSAFARTMATPGIEIEAVNSAREAVEGSDIVVAATNSNVPVMDGAWLQPGTHIVSIVASNVGLLRGGFVSKKRQELDDETLRRADRIVLCSREQAQQDQQADIYDRVERGILSWNQVWELPEIFSGKAPGRTDPKQITLFKNNAGQGVCDVALGARIYQLAREKGAGVELDMDGIEYQEEVRGQG